MSLTFDNKHLSARESSRKPNIVVFDSTRRQGKYCKDSYHQNLTKTQQRNARRSRVRVRLTKRHSQSSLELRFENCEPVLIGHMSSPARTEHLTMFQNFKNKSEEFGEEDSLMIRYSRDQNFAACKTQNHYSVNMVGKGHRTREVSPFSENIVRTVDTGRPRTHHQMESAATEYRRQIDRETLTS